MTQPPIPRPTPRPNQRDPFESLLERVGQPQAPSDIPRFEVPDIQELIGAQQRVPSSSAPKFQISQELLDATQSFFQQRAERERRATTFSEDIGERISQGQRFTPPIPSGTRVTESPPQDISDFAHALENSMTDGSSPEFREGVVELISEGESRGLMDFWEGWYSRLLVAEQPAQTLTPVTPVPPGGVWDYISNPDNILLEDLSPRGFPQGVSIPVLHSVKRALFGDEGRAATAEQARNREDFFTDFLDAAQEPILRGWYSRLISELRNAGADDFQTVVETVYIALAILGVPDSLARYYPQETGREEPARQVETRLDSMFGQSSGQSTPEQLEEALRFVRAVNKEGSDLRNLLEDFSQQVRGRGHSVEARVVLTARNLYSFLATRDIPKGLRSWFAIPSPQPVASPDPRASEGQPFTPRPTPTAITPLPPISSLR